MSVMKTLSFSIRRIVWTCDRRGEKRQYDEKKSERKDKHCNFLTKISRNLVL